MSRREREIVRRIDLLERDPEGAKLEEAESTIDKFFTSYPQGHKWIRRTHESGRENFFAPNLFGGRRHLYGYISANSGVHNAMDRRGPNSLIQGPLSQVGYVAVYYLEQWLDTLSTETGLNLIKHIGVFNMVHDSQEMEAPILLLPLASYMLEHACTTCVVDYFLANDIPLNVEFEVDQEIGENLGETLKYDGHRRTMFSSMEPQARSNKERRLLRENIEIIMDIREKELRLDLKSYEEYGRNPSSRRLLKPSDVLKLNLPEEITSKKRKRVKL